MNGPKVEGIHMYQHCPYCGAMAEYTHRDGLPVCRCRDVKCPGNERWLEYDDFATQRQARRVRSRKRLVGTKPHIYFEAGSWCVCYNSVTSDAVKVEAARQFVFFSNRELQRNGR